jgi:uncharacterized protein YndB with AHSA1/START domain
MLMTIGLTLAVALAALLLYAAKRPDSFRIQRTTSINAMPEKVFALVNDFHQWSVWSPWEKLDPALKRTHSGVASGRGAVYAWEGNRKVGQGRMEIVDAMAPAKVVIKLDFIKPFEAHNTAEFSFVPLGGTTQVTWGMHGPSPFMSKLMGIFVSMDSLVGKDFETGLANLKAAAEL